MSLTTYHQKRIFSKTPEPKGNVQPGGKQLRFVVQEHHASHLHWDFRLELDGVLKSWAVPKGPSMNPSEKHLAVQVEDHPFSYRKFHGTIPKGNYGAGTVKIWDEGTYTPLLPGKNPEKELREEIKKGSLKIILQGKKLKGKFALVKFGKEEKSWLLIKEKESLTIKTKEDPYITTEGKKAPMPHGISPMLAKLAKAPFNDSDWIYEMKWDGYRALSEIQNGKVKLYSRNNQDFTKTYLPVVQSLQKISHNILLDGEIVIIDKKGKPSFQLLQEYSKQPQGTIIYYVFDLLYLDGKDMRQLPLIERKKLLKKIVPSDPHLKYSDHIDTHGIQLFELAQQKQFEGIMAKRKQSHYISSRSNDWQKIKNVQMQEAIICGFTKPNGKRKEFGALILGMYENNDLRYIGHTGSGFDEEKLKKIISLLIPLITPKCPFNSTPKTNASATWVKPKKVCQIKFSEWTEDGMMRHPVFLGLREDKNPEEVKAEVIATGANDNPKTKANLKISNLHKVFWPKEGYTKGDLLSYYDRAANYILPYLKNRPESLNRHPNGILADSFYQKDLINHPAWVKTVPIYSKADKKNIHWLVCNDKDTLLYMANLGCIEINPWSSRVNKKDYPDYLIIDLDPNGVDFKEVVTTARTIKTMLDKAKIEGFIKTSGKTGLHIFIPLGAKYTFEQTKLFAELLARAASYKLPHTTSVVRDPKKREKKVYIDFLQNRIGQTIAAPYSLRPVAGACVSTPLHWEELHEGLKPTDFTIKNIFKRLTSKGDIWEKLLNHKGINMRKSLELIE